MVRGGEGAGVGDEQPAVYHLMVFHTISWDLEEYRVSLRASSYYLDCFP